LADRASRCGSAQYLFFSQDQGNLSSFEQGQAMIRKDWDDRVQAIRDALAGNSSGASGGQSSTSGGGQSGGGGKSGGVTFGRALPIDLTGFNDIELMSFVRRVADQDKHVSSLTYKYPSGDLKMQAIDQKNVANQFAELLAELETRIMLKTGSSKGLNMLGMSGKDPDKIIEAYAKAINGQNSLLSQQEQLLRTIASNTKKQ
jgi:hypothetical protein